jgi:hypothetical protein
VAANLPNTGGPAPGMLVVGVLLLVGGGGAMIIGPLRERT